jgi:hypothetical protein
MNVNRGLYLIPSPVGLQLTQPVWEAMKAKPGRPVDVIDQVFYDTLRFKPGTATGTDVHRFFTTGIGQTVSVANSAGEQYVKSRVDTNLQGGDRLPLGQVFIVDSIQFLLVTPSQTDTTYSTSGAGTELPSNTAATAAVAGVNLHLAVLQQATMQFWVADKPYENGPLLHYPCDFGISGFAGFGISTDFEGVSNNGFGRSRELMQQRMIPGLVNFSVDMQFIQALTISRQIVIQCLLRGFLIRPCQ